MNTGSSNAEKLRRWLETPPTPIPPTEAELRAFVRGELEPEPALEVAAAVAADPLVARRYADLKQRLAAIDAARWEKIQAATADAVQPVAERSRLADALAYLRQHGKVLAAQVRHLGSRLESAATGDWTGLALEAGAVLSARDHEADKTGPTTGVVLTDAEGRSVEVRVLYGAYALEFRLGPEDRGFVEIARILLHGEEGEPYSDEALLVDRMTAILNVPPGLHHVQCEGGFEAYILLEEFPDPATPDAEQ